MEMLAITLAGGLSARLGGGPEEEKAVLRQRGLQLSQPRLLGTEIEFNVDACRILLIDDVLYTGRTIRAALDLILDFGRPRAVQLAVLVDRGHRELPIASDFTGRVIETDVDDRVRVRVQEMDGEDSVNLIKS